MHSSSRTVMKRAGEGGVNMKGLIGLAVAAAALFGGAATVSAQTGGMLRIGQSAAWSPQRQPHGVTYRVGDLTLTLRKGPGSEDQLVKPQLIVTRRGQAPITVTGTDTSLGFDVNVTVGRWTRAGAPFVLFETFSGGAHCCTDTQVIYPDGAQLRLVDLGLADGAPGGRVPRDEDGDGRVDFINRDNAFLYAFTSYAESSAPVTVTNIIDGSAVDVSTRPAFRHHDEEMARTTRRECGDRTNPGRNGACATYVAVSARMGRFDQAMAEVAPLWERHPSNEWPTGCRVTPGEEGCPDSQVITYPDFPTALRAFLAENGYIPAGR